MKIAIIGAGASGLMCACHLSPEHDVTIFDKNDIVGKKLLLTGNGRCNLTNLVTPDEFLKCIPQGAEFLSHAIHNFTPQDTIDFFAKLGIDTKTENNNRVFPISGGARAVTKALENFALSRGVKFELNKSITDINELLAQFDKVIIATGGISYPTTGSDGDGYEFARLIGHNIIQPRPALCGLQFKTPTGFQGVSLSVHATLGNHTEMGDMMFTTNGVSGPVIHKLTSLYKHNSVTNQILTVDFIPKIEKPTFNPSDKPFFAFRKYLQQNISDWLAKSSYSPKDIKQIRIPIKDFDDIKAATITRGGIDLAQVDPITMQSKIVRNLYFIGEILDVDGLSGGFNLQIAFSTAVAVTRGL